MFPEIEPDAQGLLDRGDGNAVYWEICGHPAGKPAVVLHGGPGSGCSPWLRRLFDPQAYRIVLFDQRGCGRSRPLARRPGADFTTNTTAHLIEDIEALRVHLNIERWLVFGTSWGVTLGLAYAEAFPARVSELILSGVTMTRRMEIDWLYGHVGRLFPAEWAAFTEGLPEEAFGRGVADAYWHRLINPDPSVHRKAADAWCRWETALVSVDPRAKPSARWADPDFRLNFARIVTHYFRHDAWLEDGALLRNATALASIPGRLIHARLDLAAPFVTAWELVHAWPSSELVLVEGAFHSASDPGMAEAIVAASDAFAKKGSQRG